MGTTIRHGDVVIEALDTKPETGPEIVDARGVVLAEGEATGHAHRVVGQTRLYAGADGAEKFLRVVRSAATVTHEEHKDVALRPGWYRVSQKRQYSEDDQGWQTVLD